MMQVKGTTTGESRGLAIARPSTALRTEIAGVITPSPYKRAAPITASRAIPVTAPLRAAVASLDASTNTKAGSIISAAQRPSSPSSPVS